jgi:hypothetical protein
LLLDPRQVDVPACAADVAGHLPAQVAVSLQALVDGGPRIEMEDHGSKSPVGASAYTAS